MRPLNRQTASFAGIALAALVCAACGPKRIPPLTVTELMEDRVVLDGILLKCNRDAARMHKDVECLNARAAVERLAQNVDPAEEARRNEEFERSRERLRVAEEMSRKAEESRTKVDPYELPVAPLEGVAPAADGDAPPPRTPDAPAEH